MNSKRIEEIFAIVAEMTKSPALSNEAKSSTLRSRLELGLIICYVLLLVALVLLVVAIKYWGMSEVDGAVWLDRLFAAALAILGAYVVLIVVDLAQTVRRGTTADGSVMIRIGKNLSLDAAHIEKLKRFPKSELQYVLLQYRSQWDLMDGRAGLVVGDLRKLGIMPALAASSAGAAKLINDGSSSILWAVLVITAALYIAAFSALASRERVRQVVGLMEFAVEQASDEVASGCPNLLEIADKADDASPSRVACGPSLQK